MLLTQATAVRIQGGISLGPSPFTTILSGKTSTVPKVHPRRSDNDAYASTGNRSKPLFPEAGNARVTSA